MMGYKELNLDLSKNPIAPMYIYGRVGDQKLQTIKVTVSNNDEAFDLGGYKISFEGVTNGGKTKVFDSDNIKSFNPPLGIFTYTFPSEAFSVPGLYEQAYFSITKTGVRNTTGDFKIMVFGNADINVEEAKTVITEYNKLVSELNKLQTDYINTTNSKFTSIQKQITNLQTLISQYETSVNSTKNTVITEINAALENFKNGDFYTKAIADQRFLNKTTDIATQAQAESGTDNTKFMTPARVFDAIKKWTSGKFIELTGNQTVAGTKNFKDGIIVKENVPILGKSEILVKTYSSTTDPGLLASGSIELQRDGNVVTCTFSFKPKSSQAANSKLIWALGTDFEPVSQIRIVTVEGFTYLYNDPADGNALKFGSALSNNQWATGTLTWIAKNKY